MSLIPSLLLYNPLEMFVIILGYNLFVKENIDYRRVIIVSYIGGAINLIFQYIPNFIIGYPLHTFINNFITFLVVPFLMYLYINQIYTNRKIFAVYFVYVINFSISMSVCFVMNNIISDSYIGYFLSPSIEFLANLSLRILEILLVIIIKFLEDKYEKTIEENC